MLKNILSRNIATKTVRIDGASEGKAVLNQFLTELQNRLDKASFDHPAIAEALLMRQSIGCIIALAYGDWQAFSEQYECRLRYFEHPEVSNIFIIDLKEKNACPKSWQFKFKHLSNLFVLESFGREAA